MPRGLVLVAAVASLNVLRDLSSHIGEHEVASYVFRGSSNPRVAECRSVVVISNAVVLFSGWYLELPMFDWELFLVIAEYSQGGIELLSICAQATVLVDLEDSLWFRRSIFHVVDSSA